MGAVIPRHPLNLNWIESDFAYPHNLRVRLWMIVPQKKWNNIIIFLFMDPWLQQLVRSRLEWFVYNISIIFLGRVWPISWRFICGEAVEAYSYHPHQQPSIVVMYLSMQVYLLLFANKRWFAVNYYYSCSYFSDFIMGASFCTLVN